MSKKPLLNLIQKDAQSGPAEPIDHTRRHLVRGALAAGALAGLPLARWWELRTGNAKEATGEPATADAIRKYAIVVAIAAIAATGAAHVSQRD